MTLAPRPFYLSLQAQAEPTSPTTHPLVLPPGERVPFVPGYDFEALTNDALREARRNESNVYGYLLSLLSDCRSRSHMHLEEQRGASYGQLAAIAHSVGMDPEELEEWDSLAESIPLSDRHAGHILSKLKRRAA